MNPTVGGKGGLIKDGTEFDAFVRWKFGCQ